MAPVEAFWHEILPDEDFLQRPRMSRIYYDGKFFDYPLKASNALTNLGVGEAVLCVLSYFWARADGAIRKLLGRPKSDDGLEDWITVALRQAPLQALLQDLQREGVGRPGQQHPGRLGRPAHQEHVALERRRERDPRLAAVLAVLPEEGQGHRHHLADRGVPVPEVRARDDVGGLPRQGRGRRLQGR